MQVQSSDKPSGSMPLLHITNQRSRYRTGQCIKIKMATSEGWPLRRASLVLRPSPKAKCFCYRCLHDPMFKVPPTAIRSAAGNLSNRHPSFFSFLFGRVARKNLTAVGSKQPPTQPSCSGPTSTPPIYQPPFFPFRRGASHTPFRPCASPCGGALFPSSFPPLPPCSAESAFADAGSSWCRLPLMLG